MDTRPQNVRNLRRRYPKTSLDPVGKDGPAGPRTVIFEWARLFLQRIEAAHGKSVLVAALKSWRWDVTTCFSVQQSRLIRGSPDMAGTCGWKYGGSPDHQVSCHLPTAYLFPNTPLPPRCLNSHAQAAACTMPFTLPLTTFRIEEPQDGFPILQDWLTHAVSIYNGGFAQNKRCAVGQQP